MEYKIKDPFDFSYKGETEQASFIICHAPNGRVSKYVTLIDQEVSKALYNAGKSDMPAKNTSSDEESSMSEISGEQLVFSLMATGCDLNTCINNFRWVLKLNGSINDKVSFTDPLLDKLSYADMKALLGEYLKIFLCISQVD